MKTLACAVCLVLLSVLAEAQQPAPPPARATVIRAGRLIDPATGTVATNQTIIVENGRITAVGANLAIPAGAEVVDLSRLSVLPGLVDAHNHLGRWLNDGQWMFEDVDDLINEIRIRAEKGERVLVTTLTKRMSEDLTDYLQQVGVRVRYMHSDIDAIERMEIVRGLRLGEFDVLVGINLLREGLDMPEVSLVAILDADQEGFLRSDRSLIQTVGRAARHVNGKAIFYADRITGSMQRCMDETSRRREIQTAHNLEHGITPISVSKSIDEVRFITRVADARLERDDEKPRRGKKVAEAEGPSYELVDPDVLVKMLEDQMREAATALDFEAAARLRDQLFEVKARMSGAATRGKVAADAKAGGGR